MFLDLIKHYLTSFQTQGNFIKASIIIFQMGALFTVCYMLKYFYHDGVNASELGTGLFVCSLSAFAFSNLIEDYNKNYIPLSAKVLASVIFGVFTIGFVTPLFCSLLRGILE